MAIEVSSLTNTRRLINRGARSRVIEMIRSANPSTIYDNLNWDEFGIYVYLSEKDNEAGLEKWSDRTYPFYTVSLKDEHQSKYASTTSAGFKLTNPIHIDDVYIDLFGNNLEFYIEDKDAVAAKIQQATGFFVSFKTVETFDDGNRFTAVLEYSNYGNGQYKGLLSDELGYGAFMTSDQKGDTPRLTFTFVARNYKPTLDLTPSNGGISQPELSANRQDIYEAV